MRGSNDDEVIPDLYDCLSSVEHETEVLVLILCFLAIQWRSMGTEAVW